MLKYGSEAWVICKCNEYHIVANAIRFLRTAVYPKFHKMKSTDVLEDIVLENIQNFRNRWRSHVERMPSEILKLLGQPLIRSKSITGQWT